jgi:DNA invertase Pin-like site-specific DNA recombinase
MIALGERSFSAELSLEKSEHRLVVHLWALKCAEEIVEDIIAESDSECLGMGVLGSNSVRRQNGFEFGRALLQLLQDVLDPARTFSVLLVYDISRWGRFQDTDESAHYEFLCRRAGVRVVYCAEPFENDGSAMANIMKAIKRSMAAEYSRELSNKVALGKRRIAEQGFAQTRPCFGMRRMIVTEDGRPKGIAERGQRKAIQSDRVIFVPGPPDEVAAVRRIFRMFVRKGLTYTQIAQALNREGVRTSTGAPWIYERVRDLLTNELVIGTLVYGKTSYRLRRDRQIHAPSTWVRLQDAFEGIVPKALFRKAQKRIANLAHWDDPELLTSLRALYHREGRLTRRLIDEEPRTASASTYASRFGGLENAYRLAGYEPDRFSRVAIGFRRLTPEAMLERLRALLAREGFHSAFETWRTSQPGTGDDLPLDAADAKIEPVGTVNRSGGAPIDRGSPQINDIADGGAGHAKVKQQAQTRD